MNTRILDQDLIEDLAKLGTKISIDQFETIGFSLGLGSINPLIIANQSVKAVATFKKPNVTRVFANEKVPTLGPIHRNQPAKKMPSKAYWAIYSRYLLAVVLDLAVVISTFIVIATAFKIGIDGNFEFKKINDLMSIIPKNLRNAEGSIKIIIAIGVVYFTYLVVFIIVLGKTIGNFLLTDTKMKA